MDHARPFPGAATRVGPEQLRRPSSAAGESSRQVAPEEIVWRTGREPLWVGVRPGQSPEDIFRNGLRPADPHGPIDFVPGGIDSDAVVRARPHAAPGDYYLVKVDPPGGIHEAETLRALGLPAGPAVEGRVVFGGGIDRRHIAGLYPPGVHPSEAGMFFRNHRWYERPPD
ncbi:hypothetical protein ACFYSC_13055 [Streptosporangium sp. NPDC004379]|uniref:hypothetical protein n=1 Tax=Streptosporangium sp. NPDC004379 TaxID=3366189 RepID=UPI0036A8AC38